MFLIQPFYSLDCSAAGVAVTLVQGHTDFPSRIYYLNEDHRRHSYVNLVSWALRAAANNDWLLPYLCRHQDGQKLRMSAKEKGKKKYIFFSNLLPFILSSNPETHTIWKLPTKSRFDIYSPTIFFIYCKSVHGGLSFMILFFFKPKWLKTCVIF